MWPSAGTCTLGPSQAHSSASSWLPPAGRPESRCLWSSPSSRLLPLQRAPSVHCGCDIARLLSPMCAGTRVFQDDALVVTALVNTVPVFLRDMSYTKILATVLQRPVALSTRASYLVALVLLYGTTEVIHP